MKRIPDYGSSDTDLPLPDKWIKTLHDSGVPIYMVRLILMMFDKMCSF